MHSDAVILSIDNGTQSIRTLLFDIQGNLLAKSQVLLTTLEPTESGWAEQEADYFWTQLAKCCQLLWQQPGVIADNLQKKIVAVALTTQRGTIINVDQHGQALRPAILWLDQRMANQLPRLAWYWRWLLALVGQRQSVRFFQQKAQINWLAEHQAALLEKSHKVLLLSGYLSFKLTGKFHDSIAAIVGYLPFDYKRLCWAHRYHWKWQALAVKREQLPELVVPGMPLGHITEQAANVTGIPFDLPLIAAGSDKACEVLGSGCLTPATAHLSYGTTATINTNNVKYVEPQAFIPPFPSAIPHQYNSEVMIYRGFWMVSWFKQQFAHHEIQQATTLGVEPESLLDNLVEQVPAGSEGLILQPYWAPGIKNLEAKGAIIGFSDIHTRAHVYRAILEGLAFALREGKEQLERRQQQPITQLIISGGGSQSDAAMQLTANIFNLPASRPNSYETSGLGAAMNAAVGLGIYSNYAQAAQKMTHIACTFYPQAEQVALYQQLYHSVYSAMYQRLKPMYKIIDNIIHNH